MTTIQNIRSVLTLAALLTATCLCLSVDAQAQSGALQAEIPFAFHVGSTKLSPGTYQVDTVGSSVVRIINLDTRKAAQTLTHAAFDRQKGTAPRIVFRIYEREYFLSDVFWYGTGIGSSMVKSNRELELAKTLSPAEVISVAKAK